MDRSTTIYDVLTRLDDPENYFRGIVGSFVEGGFDRVSAVIRFGTAGTGQYPHYCIEEGHQVTTIPPKIRIAGFEKREVHHGRSHSKILDDQFKGINWSMSSSFADVQELLGRVRASRKFH